MKKPNKKEIYSLMNLAVGVLHEHGIDECRLRKINPFCYGVAIDMAYGKKAAKAALNALFHRIPVLAGKVTLDIGESTDYCGVQENLEEERYIAVFNHPAALAFAEDMPEYRYLAKFFLEETTEETEESEEPDGRSDLIDGIASGKLKSKSPDGYLVLAGEFYDEIEAGKKKTEYRDFTEYNLKRTIGVKTMRFNRGYGHRGQPPAQMRWTVKSVTLMDDGDAECDPFNVPDGFQPVCIAIHLGKRIG